MNSVKPVRALILLLACLLVIVSPAFAGQVKKVTPENFIRAESDRMLSDIAKQAGGIIRFFHFRNVTPLDRQTVIRMNRDTLYSMATVDAEGGATITFPKIPDVRYASIYVVDNAHYVPAVFYKPGMHKLSQDTRYVGIGVRIQLFNPHGPNEIALVNKLQDQFVIHARSAEPFPPFNWDKVSQDALRAYVPVKGADMTVKVKNQV